MSPPADPSLDPEIDAAAFRERTVLAWHRTGLSITAGSLVQFRLTVDEEAPVALAVIAAAGLMSVLAVVESRRRHPDDRSGRAAVAARGGRVPLLLTLAVTLLLLVQLAVAIGPRA